MEPTTPGMPSRVLLAEDDAALRVLLVEVLRRDGHDVTEARDGHALVGRLPPGGDDPPPDLVVTDVRMPGPSGLDVIERLRRGGWRTPVILVTAFGDRDLHDRARRLGGCTVIDKPFELDDLRAAVRAALPA